MMVTSSKRLLSLTLIMAFAVACLGISVAGRSLLRHRARTCRSMRADPELHSDVSHDCDSHLLDIHFERHSRLNVRTSTATLTFHKSRIHKDSPERLSAALSPRGLALPDLDIALLRFAPGEANVRRPLTWTAAARAPPVFNR